MNESDYCRMQHEKSEPCAKCATLNGELDQMSRDIGGYIIKVNEARAERDRALLQIGEARKVIELLVEEIKLAPCRDNPTHSRCLKCFAYDEGRRILSQSK